MSIEPLNREEVESLFEAWCQRLEANTDPQGRNVLKTIDGKMCCLGVLLEVAKEKFPRLIINEFADIDRYQIDNDDLNISDRLVPLLGISCPEPSYKVGIGAVLRPITADNDHGVPFPEIAKIIRQHKTEFFPILRE